MEHTNKRNVTDSAILVLLGFLMIIMVISLITVVSYSNQKIRRNSEIKIYTDEEILTVAITNIHDDVSKIQLKKIATDTLTQNGSTMYYVDLKPKNGIATLDLAGTFDLIIPNKGASTDNNVKYTWAGEETVYVKNTYFAGSKCSALKETVTLELKPKGLDLDFNFE